MLDADTIVTGVTATAVLIGAVTGLLSEVRRWRGKDGNPNTGSGNP
jgi:hypothetical protein